MLQWMLSIAVVLAWLAPWVYSKSRKPKIKGKLISNFSNKGRFNNQDCIMHFMAINIISLNKPFHISDVSYNYPMMRPVNLHLIHPNFCLDNGGKFTCTFLFLPFALCLFVLINVFRKRLDELKEFT